MAASLLRCPACGGENPSQAAFCLACGRPLRAVPASATGLLPADHLLNGRYRILAQVGKGGFGAVYQAADTQLGNRLVAIKEMSQAGLAPHELQQAIDAFQHEALLLAHLSHPNLPRIHDQFPDGGRWYLVMEFIAGHTLEDILAKRGGRLPMEEVLLIALQLCSVLDYLHTRRPPIIFRDLKPANIMLTPDGAISLIDFGIARHFKPGQSKDTIAFGSPGYAAPEQYGKAQTTPRSDIYSLGAMLHQILSGNDPSATPFRFPPLRLPRLGRLEALISQMVEIEDYRRPSSIAIVRQELQRLADQLGVPARSQPATAAPASGSKQQQAAAHPAPATTRLAPTITPISNDATSYFLHNDWVWAVAWSPDARHLAAASRDRCVHLWEVQSGRASQVFRSHTNEVFSVAWSPDGTRLASAGAAGIAYVWEAASGKRITSFRQHEAAILAVAWSPDGQQIASASLDQTVQVWDASSGRSLFTFDAHADGVASVAWAPDGTRLASGGNDGTVQLWTAHSKANPLLIYREHANAVEAVAWSPDGQHIASAGIDGCVQVWSAADGSQRFIYRGHQGIVFAVAWALDGQHLASAGLDKTVQVWQPTADSQVSRYQGHSGAVRAVAWAPDGKRIASGGLDKTVQVWRPW